MNSLSINGYNQEEFKHIFPMSWLYSRLTEILGSDIHITYEPFDCPRVSEQWTPRETKIKKIFHANTLFYLQKIFENNPKAVLDIGCGQNLWKLFWPQITGIDADTRQTSADKIDFFDDDFVASNHTKYDGAIAINSLHFISLDMIEKTLQNLCQILKPNSRAYITFCSAILRKNTSEETFKQIFGSSNPSQTLLSFYLNDIIKKSKVRVITLDNFMEECDHDSIDGNFRLLFTH